MKKNILAMGMAALSFIMVLTGCPDSGGSDPDKAYYGYSGGTYYGLKIAGDKYTLTRFGSSGRRSLGSVIEEQAGGTYTLRPSSTAQIFTATVLDSGLAELSGSIKWTEGGSGDPDYGPGQLEPDGVETDNGDQSLQGIWDHSSANYRAVISGNRFSIGSNTRGKISSNGGTISFTNSNDNSVLTYAYEVTDATLNLTKAGDAPFNAQYIGIWIKK